MVKRHTKATDGKYHINGKKFDQLVGSRAQVFHGTAYKTTSGAAKPKGDALTRKDLKKNKHHRIVSAAKSAKGPQMLKRLHNKGYFTQKGKFGAVKRDNKTKKHGKTRKVRKVIIHEKRSVKSGRFTKGGKHH
jgi:hypothetical protein